MTVGLAIGLAIGPPSSSAAPAPQPSRSAVTPEHLGAWAGSPDVVSSAQPSVGEPSVTDVVVRSRYDWEPGDKTIADAVSSATCPGCQGIAVTVATVYAPERGRLAADNVATAWSAADNASAAAVSVQLVFAPRAGSVVAANRSLAVNAACAQCDSTAIAVQFVVVGRASGPVPADITDLLHTLGITLSQHGSRSGSAPGMHTPRALTTGPATGPAAGLTTGPTAGPTDASVTTQAQGVLSALQQHYGAGSTRLDVDVKTG